MPIKLPPKALFPALLLAGALSLAACADDGTGDAETGSDRDSTKRASTTSTTAGDDGVGGDGTAAADAGTAADGPRPIVDGTAPAASQLDWLVAVINDEDGPGGAELAERFAPDFLAQVPPASLVVTIEALAAEAERPFMVERFDPADPAGTAGSGVIVSSDGTRLGVDLVVSPTEPHQIKGLLLNPASFPEDTLEGIDEAMKALGSMSAAGVYDVTDGACQPVAELRGDEAVPVGSAFKLWVLAELADQVESGTVAWDDEIAIVDALKSSPDGVYFQRPAGEMVSLVDLATEMIASSDNTATDHVLAHLGRENVEAAIERIGVLDPGAHVPLLSTGNMFALKFVADGPNADDYRALDVTGKREMVETLDAEVFSWVEDPTAIDLVNADGVTIGDPRDLDIEWWVNPRDLCLTHVHLADLAERPGLAPVAEILEHNPGGGLPFDRDRFPTIRFKGGSEPGVVAGAWWLERSDGRRFVVAGGIADPDEAFSEVDGVMIVASMVTLIG